MDENARDDTGLGDDSGTTALESPTAGNAQITVPVDGRPEPVTVPVAADGAAPPPRLPTVRYTSGAAPVPEPVAQVSRGWLSPTRTDLSEPAVVRPGPGPGHAADRRRRRRWWIVAVVAVLLLGAGTVAVMHLGSKQTSPVASVRQYFDDLAAGDTTSAMTLVADAGTYTATADPLLSPAAVARVADRPGRMTIIGTATTTVAGGGSATAVAVTYSVGATTVHQTITVVGGAGGSGAVESSPQPYLLTAPFITVALPTTGPHALRVNNIPVPAGTKHTLAFPAAYVATVVGTTLIAPATASAVYNSASGAVEADFSLPAPTVAPGATEIVQAAVNRALDSCAGSTSPAPAGCPFSYSDSGATVKWKIITYPQVRVAINGNVVTFDDGGHPGTLHYDATTSVFFGLIPHTDSGTTNADVTGTATAADIGVTATFIR